MNERNAPLNRLLTPAAYAALQDMARQRAQRLRAEAFAEAAETLVGSVLAATDGLLRWLRRTTASRAGATRRPSMTPR